MRRAKRREPVTFVRSPTLTKRAVPGAVVGRITSGSKPAARNVRGTSGARRGATPSTAAAMARM